MSIKEARATLGTEPHRKFFLIEPSKRTLEFKSVVHVDDRNV